MKIVVTGITGLHNRGVEALLAPSLELMRARLGERYRPLDIVVLTGTPEYDSRRLPMPGVQYLLNDFTPTANQTPSIRRRVASMLGRPRQRGLAERTLESASVVVALGGDVFSSDYGSLNSHLAPLIFANRRSIPVVFLAQSIGPFRTSGEADDWVRVGRDSPLVSVREPISFDYVTSRLGLPKSVVHLTSDPAFLLEPVAPEVAQAQLAYYGVDARKPVIGLSISQGISRFTGYDEVRHFRAWSRLFGFLLSELQAELVLLPHVQSTAPHNDDRMIATQLLREFGYDRRIRLVGGDHSAAELKGMIGKCDLMIAERMHAAIAGLSSAVCTIAIGYSVKSAGIMAQMLGDEFPQGTFLVPFADFVEGTGLLETVRAAWRRRQSVEAHLRKILPAARTGASRNFDLLEQLLSGGSIQPTEWAGSPVVSPSGRSR